MDNHMSRTYNVAVVGATGRVGIELFSILEERNFPINELHALASESSKGKRMKVSEDNTVTVKSLQDFDFAGIDIVFSSAGAQVSAEFVSRAVAAGAVVIDNTSHFRTDPQVPLIVPEINLDTITNYTNKGVIANPNCTTIQMLVALAPLHRQFQIKRIVASTYQSVSGAGNEALDELFEQTKAIYTQAPTHDTKKVFTKQIAFNVIPHIDEFLEDGSTKEEWKMNFETKKILDNSIEVSATCVRVPVFIAHAISVNVEFADAISYAEAKSVLSAAEGVAVVDYRADEGYVTPFEAAGEDKVYISRLREDSSQPNTLSMWIVADNIRKGAALNAVQIAEELINFLD